MKLFAFVCSGGIEYWEYLNDGIFCKNASILSKIITDGNWQRQNICIVQIMKISCTNYHELCLNEVLWVNE